MLLKASSTVAQSQWHQKLRELLEAMQPVCEPPQGGTTDHVSLIQQAATIPVVNVNVTRVTSKDDERSSPLAKMTRIFETQKEETDNKQPVKTPKRKTL